MSRRTVTTLPVLPTSCNTAQETVSSVLIGKHYTVEVDKNSNKKSQFNGSDLITLPSVL